jgi:3-hydroxy acid dehydrogenase/malonic semialdehyde reductase
MKRKIIVTGASSGIGRETVLRLLNAGHRVVGMARNFSGMEVDSDRFQAMEIDFAHIATSGEPLKELAKKVTGITDLICCAGQGRFGSLEEFSYAQIKELMDINFVSQAYVVRAFLPQIKQHGNGSILFVGSEAALTGSRRGTIYCASKFALRGFAQSLREECGGNKVRVGIVNPGMVKTPFFNELDFAPGESPENYLETKDVADALTWMLSSRAETVIDEINLSPLKKVIVKKTQD